MDPQSSEGGGGEVRNTWEWKGEGREKDGRRKGEGREKEGRRKRITQGGNKKEEEGKYTRYEGEGNG